MEQIAVITDPRETETGTNCPQQIFRSAFKALSEGNASEILNEFDDRFTFTDHALDLEFTEKASLNEFLQKSRELFPDAAVEVLAIFEIGDHAIAEWKVKTTEKIPCGSISLRRPISFRGMSIARVQGQTIVEWSDYYDQVQSRRVGLAAHFTEWIEL